MAAGEGRGRRPGGRRRKRDEVLADPSDPRNDGPDGGDDGSAGVREPRRPKPNGPMSDAGERPKPEPPVLITTADPRQ